MDTSARRSKRLFLWVVFFACAGHFLIDFMLGIWPVFKTMARLDLTWAGLLAAGCVLVSESMQVCFGALSDRGYHKALLIGGILLSTCAVLFGYFQSYMAFLFLYLGTCLGSSLFHPTASGLLCGWQKSGGGAVMGCFSAAGMLGLGVSQMVYTWTYETQAGSTVILALPALLLACTLLLAPRITALEHGGDGEAKISLAPFLQFFRMRPLRMLYFSLVVNQVVLWSSVFLLPDLLLVRGYPENIVYGGGHFFLMLGATVAPPILGYIADRTSSQRVIAVLMAVTVLVLYTLLAPLKMAQELLCANLFFLGACLGAVPPICWAMGSRLMPGKSGLVSAFLMGCVWVVSESGGISIGAALADCFAEDGPAKAMACMGVSLLFGNYAAWRLPREARALELPSYE